LKARELKPIPFSNKEETQVKASHLLICWTGINGCESGLTKEQVLEKIKKLKAQATIANFKDLIKQNSTEPGARDTGGELGWFSLGQMVKPFEDEVFKQKVGTISDPVETEFGFHLIYKQDEKKVEEFNLRHIFIKIKTRKILSVNKANGKILN